MHRLVTVIALMFVGCAGSVQPDPAAAPPSPADPAAARQHDLEQSRALVEGMTAELPLGSEESLKAPANLDDVEAILKRDQINLFAAGVAFAAGKPDVRAMALHGQIELAWGEALYILAELESTIYNELSRSARGLELKLATGEPSTEDTAYLNELRDEAATALKLSAAMDLVAAEHIAAGAEVARAVIEKYPDNYLGYRVAADYYRMGRQWPKFETMISALTNTNPDSNGLIFLQGVAAYQHDNDRDAASGYFRKALERDPAFTRARVHLLMIQPDLDRTWRELQNLKQANPDHQVVHWAGPNIERAHKAATHQ